MRQILSLLALEMRYALRVVSHPRQARDFWFHLYHEARRVDKQIQPNLRYSFEMREPDTLLPGLSRQPISLEDFPEEYGGVSLLEAKVLAASIRVLKPQTLFEFGTFNGATTIQLALNAGPNAVVHTIDLPEDHPLHGDRTNVQIAPVRVGQCYQHSSVAGKIRQHFGNTAEFDFSPFASKCDWIFIDAAHTYEYVMSDSRNALTMLRKGGVMFWHDVNLAFEGNCRAIAELAATVPIVRIHGTSLAFHRS